MAVDHRALNAFLNVARLGSVGAAATALSLTQPAVSRTLRKLEQQLGVQLFLRHSTGMELTAFGQSLLPHAALWKPDCTARSRKSTFSEAPPRASRGSAFFRVWCRIFCPTVLRTTCG